MGFSKVEVRGTRIHLSVTATSPSSIFSAGLTVMVILVVFFAPLLSVTWRVAIKVASFKKVWVTVLPVAELPSPKFQT